MSKLSTDNPDTMPITDAVYGKPKRRAPQKGADGKFVKRNPDTLQQPLWKALPQEHMDSLANAFGGRFRRFAAMRRQSGNE